VHARSGGQGSNANVEFWARHQDEFEWMGNLLSAQKIKELLVKEYNHWPNSM
jgi:hypothetical protein